MLGSPRRTGPQCPPAGRDHHARRRGRSRRGVRPAARPELLARGRCGAEAHSDQLVPHTRREPVGPDDHSFECERCRRESPLSVRGICTTLGCGGKLASATPADDDHYRYLYRHINPVPLKAREHTAQLMSEEAADIQQQFVRGEVNALSCSTTFELGVDVGELRSVVMRNMPPTTANYVQRAGRAGRRTDSAALVLTYAQRRSHDPVSYTHLRAH